jgi:hypothetical protein
MHARRSLSSLTSSVAASVAASVALGVASLVLAACGSGDDTSATPVDAGTDGQVGSFSVTWGPKTIPANREETECVQVRLGNDGTIKVHEIHNVLGAASHHFILYRTNATEEYTTPRPCNPFTDTLDPTKGAPLMITQRADETLTLPDDVAFTLEPHQMVRLELHYLNASDSEQTVQATSELRSLASATQEADFLFIGNPDIDIAPHTMATVGPTFIQMPEELQGVNVFALTGHTHKLGLDVDVATAHDRTDTGTVVYDPAFSWSEPETVYHRPPFQISDGFRFTCKYNNTTDARVQFGEDTTDEMCFFWAYYYPSQGAKVCAHTDRTGGEGTDLCCPGSPLCALLQ